MDDPLEFEPDRSRGDRLLFRLDDREDPGLPVPILEDALRLDVLLAPLGRRLGLLLLTFGAFKKVDLDFFGMSLGTGG